MHKLIFIYANFDRNQTKYMKKLHGSILFVFCFQKELNKVVFNQFSYTSVTL